MVCSPLSKPDKPRNRRKLSSRGFRWLYLACFAALLSACGGGGGGSSNPVNNANQVPTLPETTGLQPAVTDSPYAPVLSDCVLAESRSQSCRLRTLPLIGQESDEPTVEDIMDRVVVSHEWMGQRMREVLRKSPPIILELSKPLTAIVIASDIRPSYYSGTTGAMYIDPAYLWLNTSEKSTIATEEDYRSGFDDNLNFVSLGRYVRGDQYAWDFYSLLGEETRNLNDIMLPTLRLLFHELAHANDFFPPQLIGSIDMNERAAEASDSIGDGQLSRRLASQQPLRSQLLFELADVMYSGVTPDSDARAVTATDVGLAFEIDGASDDYAYASIYEDTAMLFEEAMMKFHFDVSKEIGYTVRPDNDDLNCSDYTVEWGVRHRSGDDLVRPRVEMVLQELLQRNDVDEYMESLGKTIPLANGVDWCSNLELFGSATRSLRRSDRTSTTLRPDDTLKPDLVY